MLWLSLAYPALAPAGCPTPEAEAQSTAPSAGCLVKLHRRMLTLRHRFSGKYGIPAGSSEPGESPRCTAYRETLEESGLEVDVGALLRVFDNGFHLYRCTLVRDETTEGPLPVPPSGANEVIEVLWLDPDDTDAGDWRFPRQQPTLRALFRSLPE